MAGIFLDGLGWFGAFPLFTVWTLTFEYCSNWIFRRRLILPRRGFKGRDRWLLLLILGLELCVQRLLGRLLLFYVQYVEFFGQVAECIIVLANVKAINHLEDVIFFLFSRFLRRCNIWPRVRLNQLFDQSCHVWLLHWIHKAVIDRCPVHVNLFSHLSRCAWLYICRAARVDCRHELFVGLGECCRLSKIRLTTLARRHIL